MIKKPLKDCCFDNVHKAVRKGRAKYSCPVCDRDISLLWYLFMTAICDLECDLEDDLKYSYQHAARKHVLK